MKVCFSSKGAVAGCLPLVQDRTVDTLWDCGAEAGLVKDTTAQVLVEAGAVRVPVARGVTISGIGDAQMYATEKLETVVRFTDGVKRKLSAYIVPSCPHELIIGLDFMHEHKIQFCPIGNCHFTLRDGNISHFPIIYDSRDRPIGQVLAHCVETLEMERACAAYIETHPLCTRVCQTTFDQVEKEWNSLPEENRELIELLNSVRIANVSVDELEKRLANTNFCLEKGGTDKEINSTSTSDLQYPQCDFPEFQPKLEQLIQKHIKVFSSSAQDVGKTTGRRVMLRLKRDEPVNERNYRTAMQLRPVLLELVNDLIGAGVIEKCQQSEYNSPCLLVPKKAEPGGKPGYRLVIDYRRLNQIIENVVYPMPRIQDLLSEFQGCKVFSNVDIRHAFYTIELHPDSRSLTAFSCEFGKWQFKFLPQGLKVSPAIFQEKISDDMRGLERTKPYMDDILSGDPKPPQHLGTLDRMLTRLGDKGYKLKLSKCLFMKKRVPFLGSDVTEDGVAISEDKKTHARQMTKPTTMADVKSLIGFSSFLRAHIPYFCDVMHPIQALVRLKNQSKNMDITKYWCEKCDIAFETIVDLMCSDEILAFPDTSKPYVLYTDASGKAMSAVLFQRDEKEKLRPIGYWARAFTGTQLHWAALVKEARAVLEAAQHFDVFLVSSQTVLKCDHKPLARFLETRTKNDMVNRWSLEIQHYNLKFEWVCSEENLSDYMSRMIKLLPDKARKLFEEHKHVDNDFPLRPKNQVMSKEIQVSQPPMGGDAVTAAVAHATPQAHQRRRPATDEEEAKLLGIANDMTIKQITRLSLEQVKYLQGKCNYCTRIKVGMKRSTEQNGIFTVRDGLLYRCYTGSNRGSECLPGLALVIPKFLILTVISSVHKELQHAGRDKVVSVLRSRCYWKNMHRHIAEFVKNCTFCQRQGVKSNEYRQMRIRPPAGPGVRLAVDLWKCAHGMCLTAIDLFSQFPFAEVIEDARSVTVCNALQNIFQYVTPKEILSDNGPEFISQHFAALMESRKIKHFRSAPHSPQTNGVLERFHRYLNACVTKTIHYTAEQEFWPAVRSAIETYRRLPHTQTGEAPMFLFMAQEPVYSIDHLLPTLSRGLNYTEDGKIDLDHLHTAYALGRKNLMLARRKNDKATKQSERPPQVGDRVLLKDPFRTKVDPTWQSGWRVVDMESGRTAVIVHSDTQRKRRVNVRHLRLADPVAELLSHATLDAYPGSTKLYLTAEELEDLNWDAITGLQPMDDEMAKKADEITRDRKNDLYLQEGPEAKRIRTDVPEPEAEKRLRRSKRPKRRPVWYTAHTLSINLN